jgi:hypothetical protein
VALSPHQLKRITQHISIEMITSVVVLALEWIYQGLGRLDLTIAIPAYVGHPFVNDDKPWARRILDRPKRWWQ